MKEKMGFARQAQGPLGLWWAEEPYRASSRYLQRGQPTGSVFLNQLHSEGQKLNPGGSSGKH